MSGFGVCFIKAILDTLSQLLMVDNVDVVDCRHVYLIDPIN